jgi:U1 small nuclear ribonucleoprotein
MHLDFIDTNVSQIRIVTDTHQDDDMDEGDEQKKKKKKKPHRGYAFIVFEREKDMKGIASPYTLLT